MKKKELIDMLNKDMADEHAAIIRYLVHGWMEGEDTPVGSSLLSRSREEMWHMHWLGMIIGKLGGEPNFKPAPYPYDPTNRSSIFRSYVEYEERLIPHYNSEADLVDDPHIKRVLQREAWESAIHARKFQRIHDKLSPEMASSAPGADRQMPQEFIDLLQKEVTGKYNEMLQHIRFSWIFQKKGLAGWNLMDQAMEKMKQIAHFAEDIGGNGVPPVFKPGRIDMSTSMIQAMLKASEAAMKSHKRHLKLSGDPELRRHGGMVINLDLTIQQEKHQSEELSDLARKK
ncbi:MAG TPA: ferritin-like domain-containing protein [Thermodesulfovibrionales bacterium]|nr:ferritin-like domain-containing protein [Thermodesulfovibrionales bacterium]